MQGFNNCSLEVDNTSLKSHGVISNNSVPAPPKDTTASRLNSTRMIVSWNHIPVSEAKGIIVGYRVSYYEINDGERVIMARNDLAVPGSDSSVLIGGLNPSKSYEVFVLAVTSAGDGPYNETPAIAITSMVDALCHVQCAIDTFIFIYGTSVFKINI